MSPRAHLQNDCEECSDLPGIARATGSCREVHSFLSARTVEHVVLQAARAPLEHVPSRHALTRLCQTPKKDPSLRIASIDHFNVCKKPSSS